MDLKTKEDIEKELLRKQLKERTKMLSNLITDNLILQNSLREENIFLMEEYKKFNIDTDEKDKICKRIYQNKYKIYQLDEYNLSYETKIEAYKNFKISQKEKDELMVTMLFPEEIQCLKNKQVNP